MHQRPREDHDGGDDESGMEFKSHGWLLVVCWGALAGHMMWEYLSEASITPPPANNLHSFLMILIVYGETFFPRQGARMEAYNIPQTFFLKSYDTFGFVQEDGRKK